MCLSQIGKEISFQLDAELTLSEPHVARIVANSLTLDSALFLGNSMSVRDSDMYCEGALRNAMNLPPELYDLPWSFIRVAGNRGASGIDGILSTAIGFAAGCGQRVLSLSLSLSPKNIIVFFLRQLFMLMSCQTIFVIMYI